MLANSDCSPDGMDLAERNPGSAYESRIPACGLHPGYSFCSKHRRRRAMRRFCPTYRILLERMLYETESRYSSS